MTDILIVVDMQNDFITGPLGTPEARKIVPKVAEYIRNWKGTLMVTQDTHTKDYLETQEGKKLPVPHCKLNSAGWALAQEVYDAVESKDDVRMITKPTFGYRYWANMDNTDITVIGVCTDICVVSNALILKALFPEARVRVIADLCAGTTPEMHREALDVMRSCQVEIE